jgi:hypothetical protein
VRFGSSAAVRHWAFLGFTTRRFNVSRCAAWCLVLLVFNGALASAQESDGSVEADRNPIKVEVRFFVLDLFSINSVDQLTSLDFLVGMRWRDESLAGKYDSIHIANPDDIWTPALQIANSRNLKTITRDQAQVAPDGTVTYRERHVGIITTPLDLTDFPFDDHLIQIRAVATAMREVVLEVETEWSGQAETFTIADWETDSGRIYTAPFTTVGREFPSIVYEIEAVRHTGYWVWKVMFPLLLIVGMSWTVFWIDASNLGPQIGTATASMLTLIAYRFSLGNLLPKVSYFTRMDTYITASTLLVFLVLVVAIVTGRLASSDRRELSLKIELICRVAFPASFLGVIAFSFLL